MITKILKKKDIKKIATIIDKGGVAVLPTDTVFGLAVNSENFFYYKKIFKIKKRIFLKPLPIMVSSLKDIKKIAIIDKIDEYLIKKFMPGKITFIFNLKKNIFSFLKTRTIAIRIPNDTWLLNLIKLIKKPIFVTSANISGDKPLKNYISIIKKFKNKIDVIVKEKRKCYKNNIASTIIDISNKKKIKCLRAGKISFKSIKKEIKKIENCNSK